MEINLSKKQFAIITAFCLIFAAGFVTANRDLVLRLADPAIELPVGETVGHASTQVVVNLDGGGAAVPCSGDISLQEAIDNRCFGGEAKYRVKYTEASDNFSLSRFSSPTSVWSMPSYGAIILEDSTNPGSYLFEMKVNVTQPVSKSLYLLRNDNFVRFFLDGALISGPWNVGIHRTNITYNLTPGVHTIQIIFNAQGAFDYLFLFGDIVDNQKVHYKEI